MTERSADIRFEDAGDAVRCLVYVERADWHGRAAELRIVRKVAVKDKRAVNASDVLFQKKFAALAPLNTADIPRSALRVFSYRGEQIGIEIHSELEVDDGVLFDSTVRQEEELRLGMKPEIDNDAKEIVEPSDAFHFITNLRAIPPANRVVVLALSVFGVLVIAANTWLGWHDQFAPEALTYFYDHHGSDGDAELPLLKSLMASGALGVAVWYAIRRQLRKYMSFELLEVPGRIGIDAALAMQQLVRGRARVDLQDVIVRVVACNMEMGQYKRGSGTKERTVSFKHPVRAVVLYDERVALIPAGQPVEKHLHGGVRFGPMFRALYPPQRIGSSHGLAVHWEIQLIHDELLDQEIVCEAECFEWADFLKG